MIRNFTIIDDNDFNCVDIVLTSLFAWHGLDYELMFIYSLGLGLKKRKRRISTSLVTGSNNPLYAAKQLFHIDITDCRIPGRKVFDYLGHYLSRDCPVIIHYDFYWCPWNSRYRKIHQPHVILLTAINKDREYLHAWDRSTWYLNKSYAILPFRDFLKGYKTIGTYSLGPGQPHVPWREILIKSLMHLTSPDLSYRNQKPGRTGGHQQGKTKKMLLDTIGEYTGNICTLADWIHQGAYIRHEGLSKKTLYHSLLLRKFGELSCGRRKYARALVYIAEKNRLAGLAAITKKFSQIGWKWEKNKQYVIHWCDSQKTGGYEKEWAEYLEYLADEEKRCLCSLINFIFSRQGERKGKKEYEEQYTDRASYTHPLF